MATLKPALDRALAHEGIYSNDPDDVGALIYRSALGRWLCLFTANNS